MKRIEVLEATDIQEFKKNAYKLYEYNNTNGWVRKQT